MIVINKQSAALQPFANLRATKNNIFLWYLSPGRQTFLANMSAQMRIVKFQTRAEYLLADPFEPILAIKEWKEDSVRVNFEMLEVKHHLSR